MASNHAFNGVEIGWLIHDCFKIKKDNLTVYIDPYELKSNQEKADLILITHDHYDHCDPKSVENIRKEGTKIITNKAASLKIGGSEVISAGETKEFKGMKIEAVPAYNTKEERLEYHPKEDGCLGFVLKLGEVKIYHSGDSDLIDEMDKIKADVALLPVSGTYVMNPKEAVEAVKKIKPKLAIPMHIEAGVVGTREDAEEFKSLVPENIEVKILEPKIKPK
ncbi:MAG: MBL fold metallo-hydrolase [Candidatus Undinarchaeales archaeon]